MESTSKHKGSITRRGFLKTTGSMAAVVAAGSAMGNLTACAPVSSEDESRELSETGHGSETIHCAGSCRGNCFQGCFLDLHIRDGKLVRVTNGEFLDPQYNRICFKGMSLPTRVYGADRIKYPMKRAGERGAGEWERISWDEAIETITKKWLADFEKYGQNSLAYYTGSGNSAISTAISLGRMQTMLGGVVLSYDVDNEANKGYIDGLGQFRDAFNGNDPSDWANAKTILFVGSNMTDSRYQEWHWVYEAQKKGAKLICIDPKFSGVAAKSDIFVPIRPATDAVLFNAMSKLAIEKDWIDIPFMQKNTVAPFLVMENGSLLRTSDLDATISEEDAEFIVIDNKTNKPVKASETDNPSINGSFNVEGHAVTTCYDLLVDALEPFTLEYAAETCNLDIDQIKEITEIFCTNKPSSIFAGLGHEHRQNANKHYLGAFTLAMITGNVAKEGANAGYYRPRGTCNVKNILKAPVGEPLGELIEISSAQFDELMETGRYADMEIPIKNIFCMTGDWIHTRGNRNAAVKALEKIEMLVVCDFRMSDTALYADIVLPACEWCEQVDVQGWKTLYPFITLQEKAIEPLHESKGDAEIIGLIMKGLGHPEWWEWEDMDAMLRDGMGEDLWNQIKRDKCVWAPYHVEHGYRYIYGEDGNFGTTTGKLQFYIEQPVPGGSDIIPYAESDISMQRLPGWYPPHEAWNVDAGGYPKNPLAEKYPLSLMQEHPKYSTQTQFSFVEPIRELDPYPSVLISPQDAKSRGIVEGDEVRVFNDRGHAVVKARIHNGMPEGLASMPNGWAITQYIEGSICDIMNDEESPNCPNRNLNDQLVEIEKWEKSVM